MVCCCFPELSPVIGRGEESSNVLLSVSAVVLALALLEPSFVTAPVTLSVVVSFPSVGCSMM